MLGHELAGEALEHHIEELAVDPMERSLHWREKPDPDLLKDFTVTVIGTGMRLAGSTPPCNCAKPASRSR